jgi:hypothetical protein
MAKYFPMVSDEACFLREATGTSAVAETARAVAAALARCDIAHLIAGGLAVQEHGYPRVTIDVDIIVPDVLEAAEFGMADLAGHLARVTGFQDRLRDKTDVVELILRRKLPRGLAVLAAVRDQYLETWDALQAEK